MWHFRPQILGKSFPLVCSTPPCFVACARPSLLSDGDIVGEARASHNATLTATRPTLPGSKSKQVCSNTRLGVYLRKKAGDNV